MIERKDFPILEFDTDRASIIDPAGIRERFNTDKLIITFFPEVMEKLKNEDMIRLERVIHGENPVYVYEFVDDPSVLITLGYVGCPACGGNLDYLQGMGVKKVMFCGGGGVLDPSIEVGQMLLVDGAIRDEGFSYHYIAPSRVVYADEATNAKIAAYLEAHDVSYLRGLVWTTDAMFRETKERVALRREEGAKIVEMEQAGCLAVAKCRSFSYGALIYGGDDVSGEDWNERKWRSRNGIRYDLVFLCKALTAVI